MTKAKQFDTVTVFYSDFVNFTKATEAMSAQELINELHTCFKAFDEITGRYNIEKIKTIGDAYLAVAGLPFADAHHAEHAVDAAIETAAFIEKRRELLPDKAFDIRVGIHSGRVIAGIVGTKKFSYDIWGSTVQVAALLQQAGPPGKVTISEATYNLVKDDYNCQFYGSIMTNDHEETRMYVIG